MKRFDESGTGPVMTAERGDGAATGGPLRDLADALDSGRLAQAAALYLSTPVQAEIPRKGTPLSDLQAAIGDLRARRLVAAFATLNCLYCRGGFSRCERCEGSGHAEVKADACLSCFGLGAAACDFCGGSGLATYNFVPAGLRAAVASVRMSSAVRQVETWARQPSAPALGPSARVVRRATVEQLTRVARTIAILRNAGDFARQLRKANPNARSFTHGLFTRSARAGRQAQVRLAMLYEHLSRLTQAVADAAGDEQVVEYERDRSIQFAREGQRLRQATQRRAGVITGR